MGDADNFVRSGQFLLVLCDLVLFLGGARVPYARASVIQLSCPGIESPIGFRNATLRCPRFSTSWLPSSLLASSSLWVISHGREFCLSQ